MSRKRTCILYSNAVPAKAQNSSASYAVVSRQIRSQRYIITDNPTNGVNRRNSLPLHILLPDYDLISIYPIHIIRCY